MQNQNLVLPQKYYTVVTCNSVEGPLLCWTGCLTAIPEDLIVAICGYKTKIAFLAQKATGKQILLVVV
jgi:hypothetical protein